MDQEAKLKSKKEERAEGNRSVPGNEINLAIEEAVEEDQPRQDHHRLTLTLMDMVVMMICLNVDTKIAKRSVNSGCVFYQ